eukprot:CAMPEP_0179315940 /NCGR_PEP_ID=MMETSP0797-20121207/55392_1 /TAXON_ID=47934 /ORGANISM="Dinophysis acuminata, Strain DAEP01" /LENGTH=35 /DNA_ID= /DNA_START= /DNA_END= /DNA_ORIENTATION=
MTAAAARTPLGAVGGHEALVFVGWTGRAAIEHHRP